MQLGAIASFSGTDTGFVTTGSKKSSMRGWFTRQLSPDGDTLPKRDNMVAASRDLFMNTPMAGAIIRRLCSASIGFGLSLQSRIEREGLGISDEAADKWERNVERLWRIYAESKDVDITRQMNFYQLQGLVYMSKLLSGDVFYMLPWVPVAGFPFETRVKVIESDLCSSPLEQMLTFGVAAGIKVDSYGAPESYFFSNRYPYETEISNDLEMKWEEIRAYDAVSGRRNVYHVFTRDRPGQRRGIPLLAHMFDSLKQLSRLSEAKLMHNLIQTFFTVFVKNQKGIASLGEGYGAETTVKEEGEADYNNTYEMGNANIIELDEDKDITVADPSRTDAGFDAFHNSIVTQLGASVGIPRDTLLLHFQASYSAMRGEMLEFYRTAMADRKNFALDFNQPVYEAWLFEMVSKGVIKAKGFLEDPIKRKFWSKTKWTGQGMGQIDPLKETKAAIERINANLSNHENECALINGDDWFSTFQRNVSEYRTIDASGILPKPTTKEINDAKTEEDPQTEGEKDE